MKRLSRPRQVVIGLCALALIGIWSSCIYGLLAGVEVQGKVLSCSGFGRYRSCNVAWHHGSAHGVTNTDAFGSQPGDEMTLSVDPHSATATNWSAELFVALLLPLIALLGFWSYRLQRRSRMARSP